MKTHIVEKYIYRLLRKVHLKGFNYAFSYMQKKFKLNESYVAFIVQECVDCKYLDGVIVNSNASNMKRIQPLNNIYITRKGYKFLHQYQVDKFNFFWILFKNLVIILVTAIITAFITSLFKNN